MLVKAARPVDIVGHGQDIGADHLAMLAHIGLGDCHRGVDDGARALGEPGIESPVEGDAGDDRDEDRWQRGDDREQAHDTDMQARARRAAPARLQELVDFGDDAADEAEHEGDVADRQDRDDEPGRAHRRQASQHDESGHGRDDRANHRYCPDDRRGRQAGRCPLGALRRWPAIGPLLPVFTPVIAPARSRRGYAGRAHAIRSSTSQYRGAERRPSSAVTRIGATDHAAVTDATQQQCCNYGTSMALADADSIAFIDDYVLSARPRMTGMSRSRIFLRSVLRLRPRSSAARI